MLGDLVLWGLQHLLELWLGNEIVDGRELAPASYKLHSDDICIRVSVPKALLLFLPHGGLAVLLPAACGIIWSLSSDTVAMSSPRCLLAWVSVERLSSNAAKALLVAAVQMPGLAASCSQSLP